MKDKKRDIIRTIGGVIFALSIIPLVKFMVEGCAYLAVYLEDLHTPWANVFIVLIVFFLVIVTVFSRGFLGGNGFNIAVKELFQLLRKKQGKKN